MSSANHPWYLEQAGVAIRVGRRREPLVSRQARPFLIVTERFGAREGVGRRLNAARVDVLDLLGVREDVGKLPGEERALRARQCEPRELGDAVDIIWREGGHGFTSDAIKRDAGFVTIRPAAVAGTWYPASAGALRRDVAAYLAAVPDPPPGQVTAVVAPHAGLMFSGPVGAHAYKAVAGGDYEVAVLVGPSHFVGFDGVALYPEGAFESPLGPALIDRDGAEAVALSPVVRAMPSAHRREHSLEMQLPFFKYVLPDVPIVPLLMGYQVRDTITALGAALATAFAGRRALLVASSDLSHYFDAATAITLDTRVQQAVAAFDPEALLALFEQYPEEERGRYVACGGGPAIAVLLAARALGAREARVLRYGHSGEISGDDSGVVGYMAAAAGVFEEHRASTTFTV